MREGCGQLTKLVLWLDELLGKHTHTHTHMKV